VSDLAVGPTTSSKPSLWARYTSANPLLIAALALILGLVFGAVVIAVTTPVVLDAWREIFRHWDGLPHAITVTFNNVGAAYRAIFTGSVIDPQGLWHSLTTGKGWPNTLTPLSETLTYATPLIIISIGVGIAFQTGLFNIGANGQAVIGGIGGAVVGSMIHLPTIVHVPLSLLGAILGGLICGAVPGLLKAYTGAHEVIVTLMFNYVTYAFLLYAVLSTPFQQPGQSNDISRTLDPSAILAPLFGTSSGLRVSYGIVVAAAVVVFAWSAPIPPRRAPRASTRARSSSPSFSSRAGWPAWPDSSRSPAPPTTSMGAFSSATPVLASRRSPWRYSAVIVPWASSGLHCSLRRWAWGDVTCKPPPVFPWTSRR
jgi:ABC-type uncharacterized transport system permease subunit